MTRKLAENETQAVAKSFMSNEEFISGCNDRGSISDLYNTTAESCDPVPPFTKEGLAHLAGLLSDKNTASGGVQRPNLVPEEPKQWAMPFLSRFNPRGHLKVKDASDFIEDFARQVADGDQLFSK